MATVVAFWLSEHWALEPLYYHQALYFVFPVSCFPEVPESVARDLYGRRFGVGA